MLVESFTDAPFIVFSGMLSFSWDISLKDQGLLIVKSFKIKLKNFKLVLLLILKKEDVLKRKSFDT